MASTCTATPPAATLPSKRAGLDRRLAGNSRAPQAQSPTPQASQADQQLLKPEQLDALLAPIALYPDALLALVLAAVFIVLLLIGEAALFAHAVKTMPDFLSQADVQLP